MDNPYLGSLRFWIWTDLVCLGGLVWIFSLGDPLGLSGIHHPALPLLFFLACVTGLGVMLITGVVLVYGLLATLWHPPPEPGSGLTPDR